jgi:predicted RNA-binding Zn ribbon-like protein
MVMDDGEFRLGYGAPWLDLLATVNGRLRPPTIDALSDPRRLGEFLSLEGVAPRRAPDTEDLREARRLRDALYTLARGHLDGAAPDPAAVRIVNAAAAVEVAPALRASGGWLVLTRPRDTSEALARITRQAIDMLTGPGRDRLRNCDDETCAGIYVDDSGRRRWCSDARCGTRARVRAHRARRAGADAK